jgi:hypothetical protein
MTDASPLVCSYFDVCALSQAKDGAGVHYQRVIGNVS